MLTKIRWIVLPLLMMLNGFFTTGYAAAPEAILKEGPCPTGYHTEGRYCVGNRQSDPPTAMSKDGPCPAGYHTEGHYCVGNRNALPRNALPKDGPCPTGYHTEGRYCVSNQH